MTRKKAKEFKRVLFGPENQRCVVICAWDG